MNIMPWEFYLHYGDKKILEDNYFAMKEQIRYMLTWLTPDSTMLAQRANLNATQPNYWLNLACGIVLPVGLFFYFRIWAFRLRLYKDLERIIKTNNDVVLLIEKDKNK